MKKPKVVVIVGPTASGKTALSIDLARQFNGEIISADSRQVYRGMNIATAKPKGEWKSLLDGELAYMVDGIPHHLMDITQPDLEFTVADFKRLAAEKIEHITLRGKVPFVVGGTGLYVRALIDSLDIPSIPPQLELRRELSGVPISELVRRLGAVDKESLSKIDTKNPRRVLRALEVALTTGRSFQAQQTRSESPYLALRLGIQVSPEVLRARIEARVVSMVEDGLKVETQVLLDRGYSPDIPSMSGIGYKEMLAAIRGEITEAEAMQKIIRDTWNYTKRQRTWFKKDTNIMWVSKKSEADRLTQQFLTQS